MSDLLHVTESSYNRRKHSDRYTKRASVSAPNRGFKINQAVQSEMGDNQGGAEKCIFCSDEMQRKDRNAILLRRGRVIALPNEYPFMEWDHHVLCLWHRNFGCRMAHTHRFRLADLGLVEFFCLSMAAVERARHFPHTRDGLSMLASSDSVRPLLGWNLGKLAGQSIPHLHAQYGWESVPPSTHESEQSKLQLYYEEHRDKDLILYEDKRFLVLVPWAQRTRHHVQVHIKGCYLITDLKPADLGVLAGLTRHFIGCYLTKGIQNLNITFSTTSALAHRWGPLVVDWIPRLSIPGFYEYMDCNVIDGTPEDSVGFFRAVRSWSEIMKEAYSVDVTRLYQDRFGEDSESLH